MKAEIIWALHTIENNFSFSASEHAVTMFAAMFPDSAIPSSMTAKRGKQAYTITDSIHPYIENVLRDELEGLPLSIAVDVATKNNTQFMGIMVRYMKSDSWEVISTCSESPAGK